jgi:hypothetical protein
MNAYFAEITANERMTAFHREAANARLVREARRGSAARPAPSLRASKVVAAAWFAVALCLVLGA